MEECGGSDLMISVHCNGRHGSREKSMGTSTPSLAAQTDALVEAYAALNRNDIPGFVKNFDPRVEWVEPVDFPGGGTYRGFDAVNAHIAKSRADWAEGTCEPRRFVVAGDRIVVFAHVHVRLKNETEFREGDIGDVFTFRDGKVVHVRVFPETRQALDWAGAKETD